MKLKRQISSVADGIAEKQNKLLLLYFLAAFPDFSIPDYSKTRYSQRSKANKPTVTRCVIVICVCFFQLAALILKDYSLRACLHGGGGLQVGEVTRLAVVKN